MLGGGDIVWMMLSLMRFITDTITVFIALQRHFRVLTKFAHVESRLSGRQRPTEVVFYAPLNLCDRRACSASVAVGIRLQPITHYGCTFWSSSTVAVISPNKL